MAAVAARAGVDPDGLAGTVAAYNAGGRDPAEIEISIGVQGSAEELGPKLRALGASLFTVGVGGPDYDLSGLRDWIAWRNSQNL